MPNPKNFEAKTLYDYVRDVSQGMNAGIDPLLIPRNQLAFLRNGTVRGTFLTHRPAYFNLPLIYSDPTIQTPFETGVFQGAGYYKPDFGTESIIIAVSGRLFQVQISGNTPTVSEITIPGDTQSSLAPQIWMWQAEKWNIANDSFGLPVFFDGNTSRRSTGPAASVGTISVTFSAPAIGSTVAVTFSTAFSGPFNVPLRLTGANGTTGLFVAVATNGAFTGYPVTLQNVNEVAGTVEANGSQVTVQTQAAATVGTLALSYHEPANLPLGLFTANLTLTGPCQVPLNSKVLMPFDNLPPGIPPQTGTIVGIGPNTISVSVQKVRGNGASDGTIAAGTVLQTPTNTQSTLVALLNSAYTAPAVGVSSTALLDRAYAGALPQTVFINNKQFQITAVQPPVPSTSVTLLNLTAPSATNNFTANVTVFTLAELPAGRMGCYGLGRVWQALTDGRSFIGGDIVGGSSGTSTYQKRDAVLRVQENDLLNGGGVFVVPGQVGDIRAMIFSSVLDASLGQGPLEVITPNVAFSCQAPSDRTTWQNLTNPILTESMKGGAGTGQDSTIVFNSDVMMRSNYGSRSYIQARRDFDVWGNVPVSREVDPFLATDDTSLLPYASAVDFDNRKLETTSPVQSQFGVFWTKLFVLNADPLSSLRGKQPSVYDGIWDGLNILKLVKGTFAGVERCFAICVSSDLTKIQLTEILKSADPTFQDNGTDRIQWEYFTAELNFYENDPRKRDFIRLLDGELRCDNLNETLYQQPITIPHNVDFEVFYRPDQFPPWVPWNSWTESFDPLSDPGYRNGMGLGEPSPEDTDEVNNRPTREGITFQMRVRITGHCRIMLHRFKAITIPEVDFSRPKE